MKNAAFPDQIGGCEKSMHYPDDPKKILRFCSRSDAFSESVRSRGKPTFPGG